VLTLVTSVSEVIVTFLRVVLFANTAAFFCSLLGFDAHSFLECNSGEKIRTRWLYVEDINHSRGSWLVSKNDGVQTIFSCL